MKRSSIFGALCALLLVLFAACATPTPTPLPPTVTPVPPTAVPPTVAAPSDNSAASGALAQALLKTRDAQAYRVKLEITGKGDFAAADGATATPNDAQPVTLVAIQGEVNQQDAHFSTQGFLNASLGRDPAKPFEVIMHNGNAYFKGPVPVIGAGEEKWYQAPPEIASIAQLPLSPEQFLKSFSESGFEPADFKLAGAETLDGQACQVYAGDKSAVANAFSKLAGATGATQQDLDAIESAEFKFWACADGYLHQVKMGIVGHDPNDPAQNGEFGLLLQLADLNGNITITPPADAELFVLPTEMPSEPAATPTP
ncbi:hypothetical protein FBQ82_05235 [Anaerolineae bacterium CFX7]|nr:hypothetical protein [Anaerolineae bacterium CFX7]